MDRYDIGTYSTARRDILELYVLQIPTYQPDGGELVPAAVVYCMEARHTDNRLFWQDWLAFAHMVNEIAGEVVLDIKVDEALEMGLVVGVGLECPDCGCRVMDELVWVDDDHVLCAACDTVYVPGEN